MFPGPLCKFEEPDFEREEKRLLSLKKDYRDLDPKDQIGHPLGGLGLRSGIVDHNCQLTIMPL